jgi:predicted transcriptional regulator
MKASLSAAHYAALMMPYEILVSTMKSVRRDEVAGFYGVSESLFEVLSLTKRTIYALLP